MSLVWAKAGQCNQESTIEARRVDMTHVALTFVTTCEHVQKLAEVMTMLDIAHEMSALAGLVRGGLRIWPCWPHDGHAPRNPAHDCLSEWLDCAPREADARNPLHCIAYPPWLLRMSGQVGEGAVIDGRYSFITFRLVVGGRAKIIS